jgi:hypothetical protein
LALALPNRFPKRGVIERGASTMALLPCETNYDLDLASAVLS